jgi:tetratricopeptide (TPR) repeat protein
MVLRRCLIASSFITFSTIGCSDWANSTAENTKQVIQESNVSQLLIKAQSSQKAEDFVSQGNNLLDTHRYQDAIAAYDRAIAIKPKIAEAWINRGNALTSLQRYKEAIASYDRAISIRPDKDITWYNRGNALTSLQRHKEAIAAYDQAIALKQYEAWINRGIALTKLQRYPEALKSYDTALAIKSDKHEAYYNKACSYALQGNVELAIANLKKAIKLAPARYQKLAKTDPDFNKVRSDKRFQTLIN